MRKLCLVNTRTSGRDVAPRRDDDDGGGRVSGIHHCARFRRVSERYNNSACKQQRGFAVLATGGNSNFTIITWHPSYAYSVWCVVSCTHLLLLRGVSEQEVAKDLLMSADGVPCQ